jgi:hypothetical protein
MFLAAFLPSLLAQPPVPPGGAGQPPTEPVEELIRRLSSTKFKERDDATRKLLERKDAAPALRKLLEQPPNLEMARRAAFILAESARRHTAQKANRLEGLAKAGAVDQVAEMVGRWPAGTDDAGWTRIVEDLTRRLSELHQQQAGELDLKCLHRGPGRPTILAASPDVIFPRSIKGSCFIRGPEVVSRYHLTRVFVVSAGPIRSKIRGGSGGSALFAAGSIELDTAIHSVIVSSGDVEVKRARNCLIIARGTIQCEDNGPVDFQNCRLVSAGRVLIPERFRLRASNCVVEENATMPLGFVRFFGPAREGVVVESADGGVRVKTVDAAKPFAKAGLRVGDLITAVQGEAVDSPETFRRLLRRAWVGDEDCRLGVLRNGKGLTIHVPLSE